jgi:hypothetical protein
MWFSSHNFTQNTTSAFSSLEFYGSKQLAFSTLPIRLNYYVDRLVTRLGTLQTSPEKTKLEVLGSRKMLKRF